MSINFGDKKFNIYRNYIEERRTDYETSWDSLSDFDFYTRKDIGSEAFEEFKFQMLKPSDTDIDYSTWQELVKYMKSDSKSKKTTLLSKNSKNDAILSDDPYSQWKQYERKLVSKGFSAESIANIKDDAFNIVQQLSMDTRESGAIKGLTIGDVQSGKTANMAAVMSIAADNGFNFFIILSGVIENLRIQTANRLYGDLDSNKGAAWWDWTNIDNPKVSDRSAPNNWNNINLQEHSKKKYFVVSLKNKSRLDNLAKWLYSDPNKLKQLKILIIDDEADQASINTKKLEDEERSTINKKVLDLVNGFNGKQALAVNYISYTGTPYANVLNEIGDYSLFPKDFIYTLTPSSDYLGADKMFGLAEPETGPSLPIIRTISDTDKELIKSLHKGDTNYLPPSFQKAIDWFVLVSAMQRHLRFTKPVSMLVHTSLKIADQEKVASLIREYLESMRENREEYFDKLKELFEHESTEFTKEDFSEAVTSYSSKEFINDYPKWEDILIQLKGLINSNNENYVDHIGLKDDEALEYHKGFHLVIDNSQTRVENQHVRLVYPERRLSFAPLFIVVGGNTLSRGLTLEGLVSSYFIRQTKQADTLYQMGRWFGYRPTYELFPRVWMDSETKRRFEFITQLNSELIEDIQDMSAKTYLPYEAGVKIKNSPNNNFLRITSSNKMQSAELSDIDFSGFNRQTILFKNELSVLENNLTVTEKFLNSLTDEFDLSRNKMIWRDVEYDFVKKYLESMIFSDKDTAFSNIKAFLDWYDDTREENGYANWNIILSSKGNIPKVSNNQSGWDIHGYNPPNIQRSRLGQAQNDGKTVSIGALRTPSDLISDIEQLNSEDMKKSPSGREAQQLRAKHGLGNVPQLVIYRIDKGKQTEEEFRKARSTSSNRYPLNFEKDLIGINLMIPGARKNKNLARKLKIVVPINEDDGDSHKEDEE